MLIQTPFGQFALPRLRVSRLGRMRQSRMARTRYTTLATQSVLRTQAYAKKPGSSSNMLLLHLSMLSLLPLLFDSAHGQSAYGYARDGSSSDPKGKQREIHTSSAASHEEAITSTSSSSSSIPSSSNSQNHAAPPQHPPIIGFSSQASSSKTAMKYPPPRAIRHPATSHKRPSSPSKPSSPPANAALPPEEARSPSSSSASNAISTPSNAEDIGELRASVLAMLHQLLSSPMPSQRPDGSPSSLQDMPILQACKIVKEMIALDIREGKSALSTISDETVALLLAMADTTIREYPDPISRHASVLEHLHLRELLHDVQPQRNKRGNVETHSFVKEYSMAITEDCFAILDMIRNASVKEIHKSSQEGSRASRGTRLSKQTIAHAAKIALTHRNLSFMTTVWLFYGTMLSPSFKNKGRQEFSYTHASEFRETLWPQIHKALDVPILQTSLQMKDYADAVSAYATILDSVRRHIPYQPSFYGVLLKAFMEFPVPPSIPNTISSKPSKEILAKAELSLARHEQLFKDTHAFLLEIMQELMNSRAPPSGASYHISFKKERWHLDRVSQESARSSLDSPVVEVITQDMDCLILLLRYAYQHLRSATTAERLYGEWIAPALEHQRSLLPTKEPSASVVDDRQKQQSSALDVAKYVRIYQIVDSIRLRGATLQRTNEVAQQILDETVERLAIDAAMPEYYPPERPNRMTAAEQQVYEELVERRRKYWQVDILIRCPDVENEVIMAVLAFWTATSQYHYIRYFMHQFFVIRRQLVLHDSASGATEIGLYSIEEQEIPPLGYQMDYSIAQHRMERMLQTPHLIVALLNAAEGMGNISLAEKCWLVACEEEEARKGWKVPVAAYTLILQAYGDEASHERAHADRLASADPSAVSAHSLMREDQAARSRITPNERAELQAQGKRACMEFSAAVYRRFARKMSLYDADARFFDAALHIFGNDAGRVKMTRSQSRQFAPYYRNNHSEEEDISDVDSGDSRSDSGFGSDGSSTSEFPPPSEENFLELVIKDIMKTPYELPAWAKPYIRKNVTGLLQPVPVEELIRRTRPPLVEWTAKDSKVRAGEVRRMCVVWDRGLKNRQWRRRAHQKKKKPQTHE